MRRDMPRFKKKYKCCEKFTHINSLWKYLMVFYEKVYDLCGGNDIQLYGDRNGM